MEARLLSPAKAIRTLRKTPSILATALDGLTQGEAESLRDGAEGWSILFIVCHLRDYENIAIERVQAMLMANNPILDIVANDDLAAANDYAHQDLQTTLADLRARRAALIDLLENLGPDQWARSGVHPKQGKATVLEVAVNAGLHDIDHIEQIIRCRQPLD